MMNHRIFVKRVIGILGDVIQISNGHVYVNGEQLEENYLREPMNNDCEELTYVVPADSYFLCLEITETILKIPDTGPTHLYQRIRLLLRFLSDISMSERSVLHFLSLNSPLNKE